MQRSVMMNKLNGLLNRFDRMQTADEWRKKRIWNTINSKTYCKHAYSTRVSYTFAMYAQVCRDADADNNSYRRHSVIKCHRRVWYLSLRRALAGLTSSALICTCWHVRLKCHPISSPCALYAHHSKRPATATYAAWCNSESPLPAVYAWHQNRKFILLCY